MGRKTRDIIFLSFELRNQNSRETCYKCYRINGFPFNHKIVSSTAWLKTVTNFQELQHWLASELPSSLPTYLASLYVYQHTSPWRLQKASSWVNCAALSKSPESCEGSLSLPEDPMSFSMSSFRHSNTVKIWMTWPHRWKQMIITGIL